MTTIVAMLGLPTRDITVGSTTPKSPSADLPPDSPAPVLPTEGSSEESANKVPARPNYRDNPFYALEKMFTERDAGLAARRWH